MISTSALCSHTYAAESIAGEGVAGSTGADVGTQRVCARVFTEVSICCTLIYIWREGGGGGE